MRSNLSEKVVIPLVSIGDGISHFACQAEPPVMSQEEKSCFTQPLSVKISVTTLTEDYLVDLEVTGKGYFICDRCGEPFKKNVKGKLNILFTHNTVKASEGDGDEIRFLEPSATELDLQQDIVDTLILSLPRKILCKKSCKGLCPRCGVNLNEKNCRCKTTETDPRWEALKKIKFKDS